MRGRRSRKRFWWRPSRGRYDLASTRYRQGDDTYLNTLTAQQDLYAARQGLIQAQFNELASRISLYKALGGGWK